jgi:hypothetical protein
MNSSVEMPYICHIIDINCIILRKVFIMDKQPSSLRPLIKDFQYTLIHAERSTGILLTLDGERFTGIGELYKVFDSIEEAEIYAINKVDTEPTIECAIYDSQGKPAKIIRKPFVQDLVKPKKRSWWHFW